jgi:hypothetical protein
MPNCQQGISVLLSVALVVTSTGLDGCKKSAQPSEGAQSSGAAAHEQAPAATYAMPTPDQLYQLVAPIALFPDNLVAQVLAGSTYPDQITAAWQWLQQNSSLKGDQLMQAVDQQQWDASVKGLTQFSDVLQQMASNLTWTSNLGDAYFNAPQSVMNAVQVMRQRAYDAGNLKTSPQQNVTVQNQAPGAAPAPPSSGGSQVTVVQSPPQTIIIQPAQPDVVYVPTYNPTVVYGAPVPPPPGYSTEAMVATSLLSFGVGIAVGAAISNNNGCCGWGYNSWGCGWNNSSVTYNRNVYVSNSNTFVNRNNYYNNNVNRNNINTNNINTNNINRNNVNANNVNRNNINANNVNRNNVNGNNANRNNLNANNANRAGATNSNNRANNFNSGSSPQFNQKYNQPQLNQANGQNRGANQQGLNQQNRGANQQGLNQQNRGAAQANQPRQGNLSQPQAGQQRPGNQGQAAQQRPGNQPSAGNLNQNQRQPQRGYGDQSSRSSSNAALGNYSQGGNARTNSARGQQSLNSGASAGAGARAGGGGGARGGGNAAPRGGRGK